MLYIVEKSIQNFISIYQTQSSTNTDITLKDTMKAYFLILNLHLFFYLMFLMVFFSSIKGINRLISKGMSNIYLKVTIEKN